MNNQDSRQNTAEVIPLFATPIYVNNIGIDNSIKEYVQNLEFYEIQSTPGKLSYNTHVLESLALKKIKNEIQNHINNYTHEILQAHDDIDFYITNSWVTMHEVGDYAPSHIHSNSLLSGTVYINIPNDDDSLFEFTAPESYRVFEMFRPKIKSFNMWNSTTSCFKPETGNIFLFPSALSHGTTKMTSTTEKRYCLAFNIFIKGELGDIAQDGAGSINRLIL